MVLGRIWQTIQGLRQLEKAAPDVLRAVEMRNAAASELINKRSRQSKEAMEGLANALDARLQHEGAKKLKIMELRQAALEKALDSVQIDPAVVQQRAVNSLLDTWEDKLTAAGVDKNEAASKLAAAAKLEPKKGPS